MSGTKDWGTLKDGDRIKVRSSYSGYNWESATVIRAKSNSKTYFNHPLVQLENGRGMGWSMSFLDDDGDFAKEDLDLINEKGYYYYLTDLEEWEPAWNYDTKLGKLL